MMTDLNLIPPQSRPCFLNPHHRTAVGLHGQHNLPPSPPLPPKKAPERYHHRPSRIHEVPSCPLRDGMLRCSRIARLSR